MEILHPAIHGDPVILRILVEEADERRPVPRSARQHRRPRRRQRSSRLHWLQATRGAGRDGFSVTPFAQAPSA